MAVSVSRKCATDILVRVFKDKAYSNIAVLKEFEETGISGKDKALAARLVYGVIDRKITLDYVISKYVKTPVNRIKPITLNALRIAVYQIMFMDKIPESAAVNESVNIVKTSKEKFNASFVNGVLRAFLREPVQIPEGDGEKSLSVKYSCNEFIIKSFIKDYGTETAKSLLCESLKKPPVTARVNTLKTDAESLIKAFGKEGVTAKEGIAENSVDILSGIDIKNSPLYKKGYFHIEDSACQKAIGSIDLKENMRVLDICSAPGGKAFTMAQIMNNTGEIVACDKYEHRVKLIENGAKRLGIENIKTAVSDATVFDETLGLFDVILCDVPCSGFGVIRRKPEIKYKDISENDLSQLENTQRQILENASKYLKPNGTLVYSTCTLRSAENKCLVASFLDKHSEFVVKCDNEFMPHIDSTDGFYYAVLLKVR